MNRHCEEKKERLLKIYQKEILELDNVMQHRFSQLKEVERNTLHRKSKYRNQLAELQTDISDLKLSI